MVIENFPAGLGWFMRQGVALVTLSQTLASLGSLSTPDRVLAIGLQLLLVGGWLTITHRREGDAIDIVVLTSIVGLGAWLAAFTGADQVYVAGYGALFVAPFWYGLPNAIIPWAGAIAALTLETMFVGHRDIGGGIGNGVGAFFFGFAAMFWGRVLRSSERNAELVEELQLSQEAEQRGAVVAERARLARELHDVLAHTLSSLSLHLESTRVLARSRKDDPEDLVRIERAVSLARDGLVEAREAVGTLRDDELPGPERLHSLIGDFERTTGVTCRLAEIGKPVPLAPDASVALFRGAQEALTNIARYAPGAATTVTVSYQAGRTVVTIENRACPAGVGHGPVSAPGSGLLADVGGGHGLTAMRERAQRAGGAARAGPTAGGWLVELEVPG
jgi:signal transduction histidine kinase